MEQYDFSNRQTPRKERFPLKNQKHPGTHSIALTSVELIIVFNKTD